ncbi:MAG: hypothetical protein GY756_12770 [bacterium]|nr:hypothetical protein [bacterium]
MKEMTKDLAYLSTLNEEKQKQLDLLIDKYKAFPVGTGYIDIITPRDKYVDFINELTELDLVVSSVSWWCNASKENKKKYGCPHGYAGPKTQFGWFSEIINEFDNVEEIEQQNFIKLNSTLNKDVIKKINDKAIRIIKNKKTTANTNGNILSFQKTQCLTPGIWVKVPDEWRSREE